MSPKLKNVDENLSCPLTNTPDGDFIIDNIEDNIFVGVGLSGQSVIGGLVSKCRIHARRKRRDSHLVKR